MGDKKDKRVKRRIWPTHIYDYNYKVSEGYYKPQKDYMEAGDISRDRYAPPKHQSYAERFASNPWYGNAYGYPYKTEHAALNDPLLKPSERPSRASSLLREMKEQEEKNIPLHIRASRRRKKFEDEDDLLGITSHPSRTHSFDHDDRVKLHPRFKDIGEKLRSLDAELIRLAPRRTSVTDESYTFPSGHRSSRTDLSRIESSTSSRPPVSPRVRKTSFNEEFSQLPPRPRARISSVGESQSFQRPSRRSSITEDEDIPVGPYSGRANRIREERRMKESREITEGIHKMVEKMRTNRYNPEDGYMNRKDRGCRPSSIDQKVKEDKTFGNYIYGISRKI